MLAKLALKNIRRSFQDYTIYFFTLVLGVAIFYIFNSLDSQTAMLNLSSATGEMVDLLIRLLSGVSVFISLVLGFLIIYASRFLIKKRGREFGIYLTLGMSKRKIASLILFETILTGIVSLVVGLILGVLISQVTSIFVANIFEANMNEFAFNFSASATIKTLLYFGIIYLVVMLFNTVMVGRQKLINLINADKKSEKVRLKKPIVCVIVFIIASLMLAWAYYAVTDGFYTIIADQDVSFVLVPLVVGGVATFLVFWSISGLALKIAQKNQRLYNHALNTFTFKQLSSKINTMVVSMSTICIMLFLTICLLSSALSIANYFNHSIQKYASADVEVELYLEEEESLTNFEKLYSENQILDKLSEMETATIFMDKNFTLADSLGEALPEIAEMYPYIQFDNSKVEIMSVSEYNKIAQILKTEPATISDGQYTIVCNYECSALYDKTLEKNSKMEIFGTTLEPATEKTLDGFYVINAGAFNIGFFVVPDELVEDQPKIKQLMIANYVSKNSDEQVKLDEQIASINYDASGLEFSSKNHIKESSHGLSAMATFIGLYLGLIFLISSAAILALKVLSDAIDDREKYNILRKIGADETQINRSLFKQTLIFFLLPLMLALVHTIFGIRFCLILLETLGITELTASIFATSVIIVLIYGGYFAVAYFSSKRIIKTQ